MLFPITNSASPSMNRQVIDRLSIVGRNPNVVPFVVQGAAGHNKAVSVSQMGVGGTGNMHEWQSSGGIAITRIDSSGNVRAYGQFTISQGGWGGFLDLTSSHPQGAVRISLPTGAELVMNSGQNNNSHGGGSADGWGSFNLRGGGGGESFNGGPSVCTIRGGQPISDNFSGGDLTIGPGLGRGTGPLGSLILQGTMASAAGSTLHTLSSVITIANTTLVTFADGVNVNLNPTTGTKWGRVTDKQAWFGATPIVQPAHANQAAVTDSTTGTASFTLGAIAGATYATDASAIKNSIASLARQINEIRNVLVVLGKMKGSA